MLELGTPEYNEFLLELIEKLPNKPALLRRKAVATPVPIGVEVLIIILCVINRIFDLVPLLGESLALVNIDVIKNSDSVNESFLLRERNILKKYLLIWDSNVVFVEYSAKVFLDLIMCNTDANHLRYILNEMLEGVCQGDDKSMHIFKEIVYTLMIDTLFKTTYFEHKDLHYYSNYMFFIIV